MQKTQHPRPVVTAAMPPQTASTVFSGQRLASSMFQFKLPTFISNPLIGLGGVISFGVSGTCLAATIVKGVKPSWAEAAGIDIDAGSTMQYFSLSGMMWISLAKGLCVDLPWYVPYMPSPQHTSRARSRLLVRVQ